MVMKYSELYREARKALLEIEPAHQAGVTARELLSFVSGKSAAELLADGEKYADGKVNQQEIDDVLWNDGKLSEVYNASAGKMKIALRETNPERQKQYIYEASYGKYYDKYAAMCGMVYLGRQWQKGGISRLKELFHQGYHGFAAKSTDLDVY